MAQPITEKVYFNLTVRSYNRGDHWATECEQTSVFTYGDTREEAESKNGQIHIAMIQHEKDQGFEALDRFMKDAGFSYRMGGPIGQPREKMIAKIQQDYWHGELPQAA